MGTHIFIHYKEWAQAIIQAEKSHVVLSTSWTPRRTGGAVPDGEQETNVPAQTVKQREGILLFSSLVFCCSFVLLKPSMD